MKPLAYVETSVISYLTARTSSASGHGSAAGVDQ